MTQSDSWSDMLIMTEIYESPSFARSTLVV